MSQFEKFVAEGSERADELAKAGAVLDEGFMAEVRAKTVQQEREKKKCMQPCSVRQAFTAWWRNGKIVKSSSRSQKKNGYSWIREGDETKHRTEWCADAIKYRCMTSKRGSKYLKLQGQCTGPKYLSKKCLENGQRDIWEATTW